MKKSLLNTQKCTVRVTVSNNDTNFLLRMKWKIVLFTLILFLTTIITGLSLTPSSSNHLERKFKRYHMRLFNSFEPLFTSNKALKKQMYILQSFLQHQSERLVYYLLFPIIINLFIRSTLIEARFIPSLSMHPTLTIGDHIVVDKLTHHFRSYNLDDIVVFNLSTKVLNNRSFIKRIVAIGGDEIYIHKNHLYRNGITQKETFLCEPINYKLGPYKVPYKHVLLLGDNRNSSWDGHVWGSLPVMNIVGRAVGIYWPWKRMELLYQKR